MKRIDRHGNDPEALETEEEMNVFKFIGEMAGGIFDTIAGLVAIVCLWFWDPNIITWILDHNMLGIKWIGGLLPPPHGARIESALRLVLSADKMLLFAEGILLVKMLRHILFSSEQSAPEKKPAH